MGVNTDGQICFGIKFEEGDEFPWEDVDGDYDLEEWWRRVNGYTNPHESPWDEKGGYKEGFSRDDPTSW